jgi:hypothetical protein
MKIPVLILPVVLAGLLASVYLLPAPPEMAKSAVNMDLPDREGSWILHKRPASPEEIQTLASDTRFSKAICLRARKGEFDPASGGAIPDRIDLSVVLSGHDLNNSIHRPERCMPSQGHLISSSSNALITLPNGRHVMTKRLISVQSVPINQDKTEYARYNCVTYYFFIGHHLITQDHLKRTFVDMKDRLLYGMDQHWAYVSASMWYGKVPWIKDEIGIQEADSKLQNFISEFATDQIDWKMIR